MSVNVGSLFYELGIEDNTKKDLAAAATATAKWEADNGQVDIELGVKDSTKADLDEAARRQKKWQEDNGHVEIEVDANIKKAFDALEKARKAVQEADGSKAVMLLTADGEEVTTELEVAQRRLATAEREFEARKLKIKADAEGVKPEIAKVEHQIKGLQDTADGNPVRPVIDATSIDDGAAEGRGSLLDMIGGWKTAAIAAAAVGGAAIADKLIEGFNAVLDANLENDRLAASLGLSPDEALVAGRLSGELWVDAFGESTGQVNEAVRAALLAQQDLDVGADFGANVASVRTMSEQALNLASVFDIDVTDAIKQAAQLVNSGLAPDMTAAFDLMVASMQKVPSTMTGDLVDAVDEYGTYLAALGLSGPQVFGLLVDAASGGAIQLDKTGDALKEFSILSTDMSTSSVDAYKAIGLNAEDMAGMILAGGDQAQTAFGMIVDGLLGIEDPTAQANAAIALFGTPLEDLGVTKIPAFLSSLDGVGGGLEGVAGKADTLGTTLNDNLATDIEEVVRKLSPASLAQAFDQGGIEGLEARVQEGVDKLKTIWAEYGPAVTVMVSEGIDRLSALWDEKGPEIISALSVWWSESGSPAAEEAVKAALGMAWEGVQAYFKDKVTDPDWWAGLVHDGIVSPFQSAMIDGGLPMAVAATDWLKQVPSRVATFAAGMWNPISDGFEGMLNHIIDGWNALSFTMPSLDPLGDFGPSTPGFTVSTPNIGHVNIPGGSSGGGAGFQMIPMFDSGGYVQAPLGKAVLAVVHGGELILNPAQQAGQAPIPGLKSKPLLSVANGDKGPVPGGYDKHSAGPSTNDKGPVPAGYHKNPGYGPGNGDKGPVPYGTIKGMADTIAAVGAATPAATGPAGTGDCECPPHMVLQDGAAIVRVEHVNSPVDMATVFQQAEFASRGAA